MEQKARRFKLLTRRKPASEPRQNANRSNKYMQFFTLIVSKPVVPKLFETHPIRI